MIFPAICTVDRLRHSHTRTDSVPSSVLIKISLSFKIYKNRVSIFLDLLAPSVLPSLLFLLLFPVLTQDNSIVTELPVLYTGRNYRKPSCKIYDFITDRSAGNFLTKQALQKIQKIIIIPSRLSSGVFQKRLTFSAYGPSAASEACAFTAIIAVG